MSHNELAALMIFSIVTLFCIVLCADTNPVTGKKHKTLAGRFGNWLMKVIPDVDEMPTNTLVSIIVGITLAGPAISLIITLIGE